MQRKRFLTRTVAILKEIAAWFSLDALGMYALALASEIPVIIARATLVLTGVSLWLMFNGHSTAYTTVWLEIALIPTFWSIFALVSPFGTGWWWKQCTGGRKPSEREKRAYHDATNLLQSHTRKPLPRPASWFVIDTPTPDAAVCGETLMLSRGLLESDHLPAVLAHELGHLATPDGRLTAAINRLILTPPRPSQQPQAGYDQKDTAPQVQTTFLSERILLTILGIRLLIWIVKKTLKLVNGGFGLRLVGPLFGAYWRGREYKADKYAASFGQADDLANFLENHALIHDHPIPYIWLTEHAHPPTELRIDKLRNTETTNLLHASTN
jgi:Zn-dependent protease with chaperone function